MTICSKCGGPAMYDLRVRCYEQSRFATELELEGKYCIKCADEVLENFRKQLLAFNEGAVAKREAEKKQREAQMGVKKT